MTEEVKAAAKWWADQLRSVPDMDAGDAMINVFASFAVSTLPPVDEAQVETFESALRDAIEARINSADCWRPEEPNWGRYYRTLSVDYGPCPTLAIACKVAGITAPGMRLPIKTVMWIDPGRVAVAKGYRASAVTVYEAAK